MEILNLNGFTILYQKKPTDIINVRTIVGTGALSVLAQNARSVSVISTTLFLIIIP